MIVHGSAMASHSQLSVGAGNRFVVSSRPHFRRLPAAGASGVGAMLTGSKELSAEVAHFAADAGVHQLLDRCPRVALAPGGSTRTINKPSRRPTEEYSSRGFPVSANESKVDVVPCTREPTTSRRPAGPSSNSKLRDLSSMKRARSKPNDERRHAKKRPAPKASRRGNPGEIRSPTARTLLRMLRVGTGEATANDTNKQEAEAAILRLAGEYAPTDILAKRYAGREALQVLLTRYLEKPVSFGEASQCFHNPHNRGLEATQVFLDLLGDKSWPPYPENVDVRSEKLRDTNSDCEGNDGTDFDSDEDKNGAEDVEESERRRSKSAAKVVAQFRDVITTGVSPVQVHNVRAIQPIDDPVRTLKQHQRGISTEDVFKAADEFRPVITTGLVKAGTAFHMDSELTNYNRISGARHAMLELRSFQLLTHHLTAPAALVTIKRQRSDVPSDRPPNGKPISLTTLRCTDFLAIPPSICRGGGDDNDPFFPDIPEPFSREAVALSSELADMAII